LRQDGIEIHCDEKRGWIHLACEPDAFKDFHDYVRTQLCDLPEIDLNHIDTIEITNTARIVDERASPRQKAVAIGIVFMLLVVGISSVIGFIEIAKAIVKSFGS